MRSPDDGFTAVELLITLFIAVMLLGAAYQLYTAVIRDSAAVRFQARASNLAYAELRKRTDDSIAGCTPATNQSFSLPSNSGLDQPVGTYTIECRPGNLTYARTTVTYGPTSDRKDVQHAILVTK